MPLYDYSCRTCESHFEQLVQNGEAVECPQCHGQEVERLLSLPARPRVAPSAAGCDPKLPPCSPNCCRL
jgi:putative FmdB family regulatory protein